MNNIIYGLLDPRDGKLFYVGKSTSGIKRIKEHLNPCQLKSSTLKNNRIKSLQKLGLVPDWIIIDETSKKENLNEMEVFWIGYFRLCGAELLNMTLGGEGACGRVASMETREKISKSHMGKKLSKYTRNKISQAQMDKIIKEETRKKLSEIQEKYPVIDLDTLEIFPSMMAVSYKYKFSSGFLSDHLNKPLKNISIHGKIFRWLPNNIENIEKWANEELNKTLKYKESRDKKKYQCKPIICLNTNKLYESTREAAKELNFSSSGICDVLKGNKKSIYGYKFKYVDDGNK